MWYLAIGLTVGTVTSITLPLIPCKIQVHVRIHICIGRLNLVTLIYAALTVLFFVYILDFKESNTEEIKPEYLFPFVRKWHKLSTSYDGYVTTENTEKELNVINVTDMSKKPKADLNVL